MREESLGPAANPDGSPTELTKQMLEGTGRDPDEFAKATVDERIDLRDRREKILQEYRRNMNAIEADIKHLNGFNPPSDSYVKLTLHTIRLCLNDAIDAFASASTLTEELIEATRKAWDEGKD